MRASVFVLVFIVGSINLPAQERSKPVRHIIICIDGVGFSTINKLRADGHFKEFRTPSRMISTFPSLTNQALTTILRPAGAKPALGYEDNFFDVGANKLRGGVFDRLRGDRFVRGTFRELFDYHPAALKSGLGYAAPPLSTYLESMSDVIRLRQKAQGTEQTVFFAYTGASDSLAHLGGERMMRSFLSRLDRSVEDILKDDKERLAITIFSDHGNHFRKYRRVKLKAALRRAGFNLDSKIKNSSSVVIPQFGLVGAAVLFTHDANEPRLAKAAATIEGIDFAVFEKDGIAHVISQRGEATIEKLGNRYRYRATQGDPLDLLPIVQQFGKQDSDDGFYPDAVWFDATRDSKRPDVVRRVFDGITAGVENRANVIVSFFDGYYSGSALLDVFTFLQATHGNAWQEQSYGFLMSTEQDLPSFIRADDVWRMIGSPTLDRSANK